MRFDYAAKGNQRRPARDDHDMAGQVRTLKRRRSGGDELLAYKRGGAGWT